MGAMRYRTFALLALALAPVASAQQIYKCVKNGQTQYLQVKPREGQCDPLDATPAPLIGNGDSAASLKQSSREYDKDKGAAARQQQQAEQRADKRQQRCEAAMRRQAILDRFGSRQFGVDSGGNQQYMTDAQYEQERKAVAQALHDNCG
jgi:hypothetical protein